MCEVENVEFNSDGALGITVYRGQRKGSASTSDLSEKAIAQTVAAALDIARYTSEDPFAGPGPAELMAKDIPDLDLFHPDEPEPDHAAEIAARAEQAALEFDPRIKQSDGASYDSHYGIRVYGNSTVCLQVTPLAATAPVVVLLPKARTVRWSVTTVTPQLVVLMSYGHRSVLAKKPLNVLQAE